MSKEQVLEMAIKAREYIKKTNNFKVLKIRDYSIKFQYKDIKFLWKSLDEPYNYENKAEMFIFKCDKEGKYDLIQIEENHNCYSCCIHKEKGETNNQIKNKIINRIEEYYNLEELYDLAIKEVQE